MKLVQIRSEKKEQIKYKCWAGWASEDKMRDTLKIKEWGDPSSGTLILRCDLAIFDAYIV